MGLPVQKTPWIVLETITPERAKKLLERNERNRRLSLNLVKDYARAMIDHRWRPNGETIKIGRDESLLDGQHRLHACVKAGVSFRSYVAYDIDPDTFDTIDIGRKRTGGDILQIEGVKNPNVVAAMLRWLAAFEATYSVGTVRLAADEIRLRWIDDPMLEVSAAHVQRAKKVIPPGMAAALHYLFAQKDRDAADKFFVDLGTGSGLEATDAVYVLRERLLNEKMGKVQIVPDEKAALAIRAWNHRRANHPTKTLKGMILDSDGVLHFPEIK